MTRFYSFLGRIVARPVLFRALALLFFLGLGVSVVYRGGFEVPKRTDLTVYVAAGEAVRSGGDIYEAQNSRGWNYLYLPLLAALFAPLSKAPLPWLVTVWYLLSLAALYGSVALTSRLIGAEGSTLLAASAYVLTLPCFVHTLARGQLGVLVLFLSVAAFYFWDRKKPAWAGLCLSLAVVLKTSPTAFLAFFFVARKDWKTLAWAVAGAAIWLLAIPSVFIGFERNLAFVGEWLRLVGVTASPRPWETAVWHQATTPFAADNQALPALAERLWWKTEQAFFTHSNTFFRHGFRGLLAMALGGLFVLTARLDRAQIPKLFAVYALFSALMLLFSPVSEMHHYTAVFMLLAAALWMREGTGEEARRRIDAGVWAFAALYLLGLCWEPAGWFGAPVLGLLVFSAATTAAVRSRS